MLVFTLKICGTTYINANFLINLSHMRLGQIYYVFIQYGNSIIYYL